MLVLTLGGCSLLFGEDEPPAVEIEIKPAPADSRMDFLVMASPLVNPSPDGVPAPVVMRLYQLKGEQAFVNAGFRQLWEEDEATLGDTLLGKAEIYVDPGGVKRIKSKLIEGTSIVAVVVGFRNFGEAKWRAMVPIQGADTLTLKATLKTLSVHLGPQSAE